MNNINDFIIHISIRVIISIAVLCMAAGSAYAVEQVIYVPPFDNAQSGLTNYYSKYMTHHLNMKNGVQLINRSADNANPEEIFSDDSGGSRFALTADILSSYRKPTLWILPTTHAIVSYQYVDLESGKILQSGITRGHRLHFFHNLKKKSGKAVKQASKKITRKKIHFRDSYQFNNNKPGVMVLPSSGVSLDQRGRAIEGLIASDVSKNSMYNTIERRVIEAQLAEQNLTLSGLIGDTNQMVKTGLIADITWALRFDVTDIQIEKVENNQTKYIDYYVAFVTVVFQLVNFETGAIRCTKSAVYSGVFVTPEGALYMASKFAQKGMYQIAQDLLPIEYKLSTTDKKQTLTYGKEEGLRAGEAYQLYRLKSVYDPYTGGLIGYDYRKVGRVRLTKLHDHECQASLCGWKWKKDYGEGFVIARKGGE